MAKPSGISGSGDFDVTRVFDLLESNDPELFLEIKALITENFNNTKESWLVGGLFEYYLQSGSVRCAEILSSISREPHDKFLIEKMLEGIRSPSKDSRKQTLTFLGQVVSKQPSWLYKITQHTLFKEITRLLKTETDVVVLMTGLLTVIMIIPTIPTYITSYINDIFDVFGRLATWTHSSHNIPKEHLLHLQVGLYSLFHRLYAMYPCNFLSYLRHNFSSVEKRVVFFHTIMPMLEKVKMHPLLVTATKEGEMNPNRWRSKEYHEVIAECSKISLDVYESSFPEEITPTFSRLNTSEGDQNNKVSSNSNFGETVDYSILKMPPSSLISQAMRTSDLTSLASFIDDSAATAPPTPMSVTSVGQGNAGGPPSSVVVNKTTTSPPETAMEATPENTPVKDRERLHFKLPPTSPAVAQLNFSNFDVKEKFGRQSSYTPPVATPGNSVPSSPLPHLVPVSTEFPLAGAPGHPLTRRDSIFDSTNNPTVLRRDSLMFQRLQKVQLEQTQVQTQGEIPSGPPMPTIVSTSPAPSAPQRRVSIPAPITIIQSAVTGDEQSSDFLSDRDKPTGGPLTPMLPSSTQQGQGLIDPDLSLITLDEDSCVDDCPHGGLHMADHRQMIAFAKRVSRLRFHSQCGPSISETNTSQDPSPGTSPSSSTSSYGIHQFKRRNVKRSLSCPNIKKPITEEEELETSTDSNQSINKDTEDTTSTEPHESPVPPTVVVKSIVEPSISEEIEHPYEHLFQKILPTVLSPPVESRTLPSPHFLLDLCLTKAANLHNARSRGDEMAMLRGQVELLHGQLLFERHRREAHALRNRRLAGKCRKVQNMEEQNNAMRRERENFEKEVHLLKKEIITQRTMGLSREKDLQVIVNNLEEKLESNRRQISELKDDNSELLSKYNRLQDDFNALQKESDKKKADLFCLENEIKHIQRYLEINNELRMAYDMSQKEILMLGELLRRHQESAGPPIETQRYLKEEMEDLRQTCEEEIRGLRNILDSKMSQCEVSHGTIADLQKKLDKRETIIMEHNKLLQDMAAEHQDQLEVFEKKYESVKETNHRLELEILNLQHQLTLKSYSTRSARGRMASSPSNGELSPTGNSNHSDVDSAASASNFYQISPERNSCFFGSPQFDLPPEEMKDLQLVLDQGSASTSTSAAGTRRNSTQDQQPHRSGNP